MIGPLIFEVLNHLLIKVLHKLVEFVFWIIFVKDKWYIEEVVGVDPETTWPAVRSKSGVLLLIHGDGQDILLLSEVFLVSSPD